MSSPLSTLRKARRAPLPGTENAGERQAFNETTWAEHEASLLREFFPQRAPTSEVTDSLRSNIVAKRNPKEGSAPSDLELMSSMMQKLGQLEKKVKAQTLDIDHKARRIAVLEDKLRLLQEREKGDKQGVEGLSRMCYKLQNQVWEMEKFLNDYGMIWVGSDLQQDVQEEMLSGNEHPDSSGHTMWRSGASMTRRFLVNFDLILQNIQDLNVLAGEGSSYVTSIPGGATLSQRSSAPLWLFKNGIVMSDGPFRPYQTPSTQQYMQDLMDGYFPSELQGRFPDGVVFQVHDRRGEEFPAVRRGAEFPGQGLAVRDSDENLEVHREEPCRTLLDLSCSQLPGKKLSMEHFLNKIPTSVVKEGKVINIRSSLKAHLQGSADGAGTHSVTVVETPVLQALRENLEFSNESCSISKPEVTTLRMKSEDGEKTFILKMLISETIGHLRQYLDTHRWSEIVWPSVSKLLT